MDGSNLTTTLSTINNLDITTITTTNYFYE